MLENTFVHIPTIGRQTERELWRGGITCWEHIEGRLPFSRDKCDLVRERIRQSRRELAVGNARYFSDRLPSREHWRLFPAFRHSVAYLDIETTGLGAPGDYITTITLYDGSRVRNYVHDRNLLDFKEDVRKYKVLVTYNGKTFDLPFIRSHLNIDLDQAHIDLRYPLAALGYRGGLKTCEKRLGLKRKGVEDIDGYFAVLLWWEYHNNGNEKALETLLAYNTMDTVNLEALLVKTYNLMLEDTPFREELHLPPPAHAEINLRPDPETIAKIRARHTALFV